MSQFSQTTDVVCAGGGPAGLTAAIALRLRGFRVIVADALVPPVDKACGEGLMPDGVAALRAFGIVPEQHEHAIFHGIRFLGPECSVEAHFPSGRGIGMRRTVLHEALRRRAADLGVEMNWGARVTGIAPGAAFVDHRPMNAKWIIGADGQNSRIRAWSGLSPSSRKRSRKFRIGLRRHFRVQRWTDLVEVYWCNSGQAYVTPVAEDELCVAVVSRNRHVDFDRLINQCPQLAQKLRNAVPLDQIRGSATATLSLPAVVAKGVALIGEASGSVDAITGEGLTLAFRQAVHLGEALALNDLPKYAVAHRQIARLPNLLGKAMLLMDRNAQFRSRALNALSRNPAIFETLLAIQLGEMSPFKFGMSGLANLGWSLLTEG